MELLYRHITRKAELRSAHAQHHLIGGFNRRLLMLETGRSTIKEITHSRRDQPIGVYRATELAIQLNAYYLNLCGALDNLAWAMQYEWDVVTSVSEDGAGRNAIGLFQPKFLGGLAEAKPVLRNALLSRETWYRDLRELRDPAAHRVPLYAIPGVMNEEDAATFQSLNAAAVQRGQDGDHNGMMELMHEASNLGGYAPLMSVWTPKGETLIDAWGSVLRDHRTFQDVAWMISDALLPS